MLEGSVLSKEDVKRLVACHTEEASGFLYELYRFLEEWFSDSPYLTVKTSGSTGTPKQLKVRKEVKFVQKSRCLLRVTSHQPFHVLLGKHTAFQH